MVEGVKDHLPMVSPVSTGPATLVWCGGYVQFRALHPKCTLPGMDWGP